MKYRILGKDEVVQKGDVLSYAGDMLTECEKTIGMTAGAATASLEAKILRPIAKMRPSEPTVEQIKELVRLADAIVERDGLEKLWSDINNYANARKKFTI
jgi:hypothetical protein